MGYLCGLHRGMDIGHTSSYCYTFKWFTAEFTTTVFTRSILESRPPHRWVPSGYYKVLKNIFIFLVGK